MKAVIVQILVKPPSSLSVSSPFQCAYCAPEFYNVSHGALNVTYDELTFVANFRLVKVSLRWA